MQPGGATEPDPSALTRLGLSAAPARLFLQAATRRQDGGWPRGTANDPDARQRRQIGSARRATRDAQAPAHVIHRLFPVALPVHREERLRVAAVLIELEQAVAQHVDAALEQDVLQAAEDDDERRDGKPQLAPAEGVNQYILIAGG